MVGNDGYAFIGWHILKKYVRVIIYPLKKNTWVKPAVEVFIVQNASSYMFDHPQLNTHS